ncbi:MAG: hypothetical protein HY911_11690 [Desulfobacterales bacterium]|nr:hypothetical protein [Desulfobacterales bacterium]
MSAIGTPCKNLAQYSAAQIAMQDLLAGDIIATRAHTANSAFVRGATLGTVSHAILCTGEHKGYHWAVDAMPDKGVTRETLSKKLSQASYAVVFRHRTATLEQCRKACAWAAHQALLYKPYDYKSAARVGAVVPYFKMSLLIVLAGINIHDSNVMVPSPQDEDDSFMCSELVFRAYEIAGAPLTRKPAYCMSPQTLFKTDRLTCLGRLK